MREIISFLPALPTAMFSMYLSPDFTRASYARRKLGAWFATDLEAIKAVLSGDAVF